VNKSDNDSVFDKIEKRNKKIHRKGGCTKKGPMG